MLIIAQGYWLVGNGVLITLAKPTIDEADLTYRYVMLAEVRPSSQHFLRQAPPEARPKPGP
jgi:hypothetical protein